MKIKEQTIKELDSLKPQELLNIHDMILSLKRKVTKRKKDESVMAYLKVREALKQCKGSLSEDIRTGREDRI